MRDSGLAKNWHFPFRVVVSWYYTKDYCPFALPVFSDGHIRLGRLVIWVMS
jgi:hypothetical protein